MGNAQWAYWSPAMTFLDDHIDIGKLREVRPLRRPVISNYSVNLRLGPKTQREPMELMIEASIIYLSCTRGYAIIAKRIARISDDDVSEPPSISTPPRK